MIRFSSRYVLSIGVAAALLAGCGGMPQSSAIAAHVDRNGSWMAPESKSEDLLYVNLPGESSSGSVAIFTYPGGSQVGQLSAYGSGLCSDPKGDVFVTQGARRGDSAIVEYAHGGTTPIATLDDPYLGARGCSVDPATGNLAVANTGGSGGASNVVVYPNATGTPTVYSTSFRAEYCGYDGTSDLFVIGSEGPPSGFSSLAELKKGSSRLTGITQNKAVVNPDGVQWDGKYLALGKGTDNFNHGVLYRKKLKGNRATTERRIPLGVEAWSFFIEGSTLLVPDGAEVYFFSYPGGVNEKFLRVYGASAVTVSLASSRSRIRE